MQLKSKALFTFLLLFYGVFLLYPLFYIVQRAFYIDGKFTLGFLRVAFNAAITWEVIKNSVLIAFAATALSAAIGTPLAFLMTRRTFPGKGIVSLLLILPLVVPPFVGALGVRQLLGRFGSLNLLLLEWGIIETPIDLLGANSMNGVVFMQALHLYPFFYLFLSTSLSSLNASFEEAAETLGAGKFRRFLRIVAPIIAPGFFASSTLVFISSLTDLGTPLFFNLQKVIPIQIYNMLSDVHENGVGYVMILMVTVLCLIAFLVSKALLSGYQAGSQRGVRAAELKSLSPLNAGMVYGALTLLLLLSFLPYIGVLLLSFSDRWFMSPTPVEYSFESYRAVFKHPFTLSGLKNSFILSLMSTAVNLIISLLTAILILRSKRSISVTLEVLSSLPLAIPGIVFAFGYAASFSGTLLDNRINPLPLLVIAYSVRRLPFLTRSAISGLQESGKELEGAARTLGASPLQVVRRITIPLLSAHLFAGAILCFAFNMIEVSDSLILALEERHYPVSKVLYALTARPDGLSLAAALAVLIVLFIVASLIAASVITKRPLGELFKGPISER